MSTKTTPWEISDALWEKMEPLLPKPANPHPRGGGLHGIQAASQACTSQESGRNVVCQEFG